MPRSFAACLLAFCIAIPVFTSIYLEGIISVAIPSLNGEETTLKISRKEAQNLRALFQRFLIWESFGYTLCGCKPISFLSYKKPFTSLPSVFPSNLKIKKGWECFKKISSSRFQFWEEENPWVKNEMLIVILDREELSKTLKENELIFGKYLDPINQFMENPLGKSFFKDVLNKDEFLIGISLGYGTGNAKYYSENSQKKTEMRDHLIWGAISMERQVRNLWCQSLLASHIEFSNMLLPGFVAIDSEETKELKTKLLDSKKRLIHYFSNKDILPATLSLIKNGPEIL